MASTHEIARLMTSDQPVLAVQVLVNDPRACPTAGTLLTTPTQEGDLLRLESLAPVLQAECSWYGGYIEEIKKTSGGIGADGLAITSLFLGAVGALPTVQTVLRHLKRSPPARPDHDGAWKTATWAVTMQYPKVQRRGLVLLSEARNTAYWTFVMELANSGHVFSVDVAGIRGGGTVVTKVTWTNGDPWGEAPGTTTPDQ